MLKHGQKVFDFSPKEDKPEKSLAELLDERQRKAEQGPWVVACGGQEPVMTVNGVRVQYMWQPTTGRHAYYCLDTDLILSDEDYEALCGRYCERGSYGTG